MNHLDSLTPTIVLVTGAIINHVCKDGKDLTTRDVMLMLSPTIPTLIPILISLLKTVIAFVIAPPSTKEEHGAPVMQEEKGIWAWVQNALKELWTSINQPQHPCQEMECTLCDHHIELPFQTQTVKCTDEFICALSRYVYSKQNDTCFYQTTPDTCYEIKNATNIEFGHVWSNIRIQIPVANDVSCVNEESSHVEIQLKHLNVKMMVDPKGTVQVASATGGQREVNLATITRYSDFIVDKNDRIKFQSLFSTKTQNDYLNMIRDEILKLRKSPTMYDYKGPYDIMIAVLVKTQLCPNLNIELALVDTAILSNIVEIGCGADRKRFGKLTIMAYMLNSLFVSSKLINKYDNMTFNLFGYKCIIDCTKNNVWNNQKVDATFINCDAIALKTDYIPSLTVWINELYQLWNDAYTRSGSNAPPVTTPISPASASTELVFQLPTIAVCPAIHASFQAFLLSVQNGKFHKGSSTTSSSNSKVNIYNMCIERKEVRVETPNPAYAEYEEKRDQLSNMEKNERTAFLVTEFMRQPIPPKMIVETKLDTTVNVGLVNAKAKRFDSLYLREMDMRKLHNILTKFKTSTELYETYGLPNKLGVLLHGEPGTGKTSAIHAIATFLEKNIYYTNLSNVETNKELQMLFDHVQLCSTGGGIIVFEDIDAMTNIVHRRAHVTSRDVQSGTSTPDTQISTWKDEKGRSKSEDGDVRDENRLLTLEYLLNLLQGSLTRDGTIFIATTNHKEKLDPALCRVGRFDVDIEMKKCDYYQIKTMYNAFIQRNIPTSLLRRIPEDQFTPAEFIFRFVQYIQMDDVSDEEILAPFLE